MDCDGAIVVCLMVAKIVQRAASACRFSPTARAGEPACNVRDLVCSVGEPAFTVGETALNVGGR